MKTTVNKKKSSVKSSVKSAKIIEGIEKFRKEFINDTTWIVDTNGVKYLRLSCDYQHLIKYLKIIIKKAIQQDRQEMRERVECIFDKFRSSNQKKKGVRIFGVAGFKINIRHLYNDLLDILDQMIGGEK